MAVMALGLSALYLLFLVVNIVEEHQRLDNHMTSKLEKTGKKSEEV